MSNTLYSKSSAGGKVEIYETLDPYIFSEFKSERSKGKKQ